MDATVLIVGGGIGGLAAAVGLRRVGVTAMVFERAPELTEVGAGLSLWSNAVNALGRLGLREAVVARGSVLERGVTMAADGRQLGGGSLTEVTRKAGAPSICVHRAELQKTLAAALEAGQVRLGADCVGFEQDGGGVTVRFANGNSVRGGLLIGADGIRSAVRRQLLGPAEPRYAGYFAYRGIADTDHPELPPGVVWMGHGPGAQVGLMPCGAGRVYWFATVNGPAGVTPPGGAKKEALGRFGKWAGPVPAVIESTREEAVLRNDVIDRPPAWPWGTGRVSLLGDAIHPTTPNLGQGACQALEDAVVLADNVRRLGARPEALRAYEEARRQRTAFVTNKSWSLGKMLQWESGLLVWLRNAAMRSGFGKRSVDGLFAQLLCYELPALDGAGAA